MRTLTAGQPVQVGSPKQASLKKYWRDFESWFLSVDSYGAIARFPKQDDEWKQLPVNYRNSRKTFERYFHGYQSDCLLGLHFGFETNRLVLDLDSRSQYHPHNATERFNHLLLVLEDELNLCGLVIVRSSKSGGLHLYYPLPKPRRSKTVYRAVLQVLEKHNFDVRDGQIEIFPKVDHQGKSLQGLRLPLQTGSYLLDPLTLEPISQHPDEFLSKIRDAKPLNADAFQLPKETGSAYWQPLPKFTQYGQTNEIMGQMANIGHLLHGHADIPSLAQWMRHKVPQLEGYQQFASADSKYRLENKSWCDEWAKSHFKSTYNFQQKRRATEVGYHTARSTATQERLSRVVSLLSTMYFLNPSERTLKAAIQSKSKELFGIGFSERTLQKYKSLWLSLKPAEAAPAVQTLIKAEERFRQSQQGIEGDTQLSAANQQTFQEKMLKFPEYRQGDRVVADDGTSQFYCGKEATIVSRSKDSYGNLVYKLDIKVGGRCLEMLPSFLRPADKAQAA